MNISLHQFDLLKKCDLMCRCVANSLLSISSNGYTIVVGITYVSATAPFALRITSTVTIRKQNFCVSTVRQKVDSVAEFYQMRFFSPSSVMVPLPLRVYKLRTQIQDLSRNFSTQPYLQACKKICKIGISLFPCTYINRFQTRRYAMRNHLCKSAC